VLFSSTNSASNGRCPSLENSIDAKEQSEELASVTVSSRRLDLLNLVAQIRFF